MRRISTRTAGAAGRKLTFALLLASVTVEGPGGVKKAGEATNSHEILEAAAVHDAGRIHLALSGASTFGGYFLPQDPPRNAGQWPGDLGQNYLAGGGLWIGTRTDSVDRVVHHYYTLGSQINDWMPSNVEYPTTGADVSDQDIRIVYSDSAAPSPFGLQVEQTTRQWSEPGFDDFLIFEYRITNTSDRLLENVFASVWLDPDLVLENGTFVFDDLVGWDRERNMIYASDAGTACNDPLLNPENILCPPGHVGLVLLSHPFGRRQGRRPHSAVAWNAEADPERTIEDTDSAFFSLMTGDIDLHGFDSTSTTPDDYRMLLTAQPMALAPGKPMTVVFGMVIGESLEALQTNADAMLEMFESTPLASEDESTAGIPAGITAGVQILPNYPNPFSARTTIPFEMDQPSQVRVSVFNLLGAEVAEIVSARFTAGRHQIDWSADDLPNGIYICRLDAGGSTQTLKLTLLK